jgi:hypothetical protein
MIDRADLRAVARIDGTYPRLSGGEKNLTDCAFAKLLDGVRYDAASLGRGALTATPALIAMPALIEEQLAVTKLGRVTDARPGVITKIEVEGLFVRYGTIRARFDNLIQIGSSSTQRFCAHGDSGALIFTPGTLQPVGLLIAASYSGGPHDAGWTWAHPIRQVEDALHVDLVSS